MSWLDNIDLPVMINTGDNKYFSVLWKPEELNIEWNIAEFEFDEKDGTLVKRGRVKGRRLPLRIFFQGDDHLDQAADFLRSTLDRRPWVISHPMYKDLIVQPISLKVNNVDYNVTEMTGTLVETIIDDGVIFTPDPIDKVTNDKSILDETFVTAFDVTPDATDINSMLETNNALYASGNKLFSSDEYFNAYKDANKAVLNATAKPLEAMRKVQAFINAPALFTQSVSNRVSLFQQQFESLRLGIESIADKSSKLIYQTQGSSLISCMCLAAANPLPKDYNNSVSITTIIEMIIDNYNTYIEDLDELQSENGGEPGSFIPDADSMVGLNQLVNFTVTNLVKIALGAKQQRTIILENDSNWISLAHRFYGLDAEDENINTLMENNAVGLDTLMGVRKGAQIVYYV
jgi:hypothetical protein